MSDYVALLSPAQAAAHRRIEALQKVYDAARAVAAKDEIASMYPEDADCQELLDEAMCRLDAALWNTAHVLEEPYPFEDAELSHAS